jgi:hypothetical protein
MKSGISTSVNKKRYSRYQRWTPSSKVAVEKARQELEKVSLKFAVRQTFQVDLWRCEYQDTQRKWYQQPHSAVAQEVGRSAGSQGEEDACAGDEKDQLHAPQVKDTGDNVDHDARFRVLDVPVTAVEKTGAVVKKDSGESQHP